MTQQEGVVFDSHEERRKELAVYEIGKQIVERGMENKDLWLQLPERNRGMLSIYYRSGNPESQKQRLSMIFNLPPEEVDQTVLFSLEQLDQLLRASLHDGTIQMSESPRQKKGQTPSI